MDAHEHGRLASAGRPADGVEHTPPLVHVLVPTGRFAWH
jgi:hypothetical protein